jgi:hypothetical protein
MYTLVRSLPLRQLLLEQAIPFTASFLIADRFYKFHSFALETLAFLATWFVLDLGLKLAYSAWRSFSKE